MIATIGKKLVNLQRPPYMPPNLVNLVQKRLRTVGEFLPTPKFLHWEETLPALLHGRLYNRQQANFINCRDTEFTQQWIPCHGNCQGYNAAVIS